MTRKNKKKTMKPQTFLDGGERLQFPSSMIGYRWCCNPISGVLIHEVYTHVQMMMLVVSHNARTSSSAMIDGGILMS